MAIVIIVDVMIVVITGLIAVVANFVVVAVSAITNHPYYHYYQSWY